MRIVGDHLSNFNEGELVLVGVVSLMNSTAFWVYLCRRFFMIYDFFIVSKRRP